MTRDFDSPVYFQAESPYDIDSTRFGIRALVLPSSLGPLQSATIGRHPSPGIDHHSHCDVATSHLLVSVLRQRGNVFVVVGGGGSRGNVSSGSRQQISV